MRRNAFLLLSLASCLEATAIGLGGFRHQNTWLGLTAAITLTTGWATYCWPRPGHSPIRRKTREHR